MQFWQLAKTDLPPKKESSVNVRLEVKKGGRMVRKGYTQEQIINKLREAEVLLSQGTTVGEASRKIGVTEQAKRLKELGKENTRSKL